MFPFFFILSVGFKLGLEWQKLGENTAHIYAIIAS